ncbi:MAG: anti-sigma factor family protein [Chloroflexota bacterium]
MQHINEELLNEYLDDLLDAPARAAADEHLAACASCRRALADLETVTSLLASLPDEPLTRDLTPSVLAGLPQPRLALGWKLVFAVEAGIGLGMGMLVLANLKFPLQPQAWLAHAFTTLSHLKIPSLAAPLLANHYSFPAIEIPAAPANLVFLALSALLLWGVGNAVLLRGRPEVRE